jgi:hypothetical protein
VRWWHPVVLAVREIKAGESQCEANLDKDKLETISEKQTKEIIRTGVWLKQ